MNNIKQLKQLKQLINKTLGFDPENESDCLKAVKQDGYNIQYIHNPSKEIKLAAVKQDPFSIRRTSKISNISG